MEFLGLVSALSYVLVAMWVLPIFPLLYVIMRWRSGQGQAGAGTHAAMFYFTTVGFLIALSGGANLVYGAISVTPVNEVMTRISWGMLTGALVFAALNMVLMRSLNALPDSTDVERVFTGFLMVVTGMVALAALVLMTVSIFREAATEREATKRTDEILMYGVWMVFFLATYLVCARILARNAREQQAKAAFRRPG